jgi:hypothetical protein
MKGENDLSDYYPEPIDTSKVNLPEGIDEIIEIIAKNTHDTWAKQRIKEGWKYGPVRDDARKQHPSLVEYSNLSESEKEYDRKTAMETLKLIIAMGYEIKKR